MKNPEYPNLVIAGAPKCGTSSLFFWLAAHPEVCASKVKETYFLSDRIKRQNKTRNYQEHGWQAYASFFEHYRGEKHILEATPSYIYDEIPRQKLSEKKEVQIIFILRKPGDRLYSHWQFNRYRRKNIKLSFEQYLDFETYAPKKWANYINRTNYIEHIKPWLEAFGQERIHVYQFEQMKRHPESFMKIVAGDLNLDPAFYDSFNFFHRNKSVKIGSKKLHSWGLKLQPMIPQFLQELLIPLYLKVNSAHTPAISEKEELLKDEINKEFLSCNKELKEYFPSIDLSLWH